MDPVSYTHLDVYKRQDLRRRIENILLGFTYDNKPFTVKDLGVAGALTKAWRRRRKVYLRSWPGLS